jgi:hypothetical protein
MLHRFQHDPQSGITYRLSEQTCQGVGKGFTITRLVAKDKINKHKLISTASPAFRITSLGLHVISALNFHVAHDSASRLLSSQPRGVQ